MNEPEPLPRAAELPSLGFSDDIAHILWRDRDAEVRDFSSAERRTTSLWARLQGCAHSIGVQTATSRIHGQVLGLCDDFIVLGDRRLRLLKAVVATSAVLSVHAVPMRTISQTASVVDDNTRIAAWLDSVQGHAINVHVGAAVIGGMLAHMWADHLDVVSNGQTVAIPLKAVHLIQVVQS